MGCKAAAAVAVIGFLFWRAQQAAVFEQLVDQPKKWHVLALGLACTLVSVVLSFVRWSLVARAAELDLSLPEALRVGALGFALNFVSPGAVGGDVFKAVVVARGRPGRRARAVTTIAVDRLLALLSKLIVAGSAFVALCVAGASMTEDISAFGGAVVAVAAVGVLAAAAAMIPGVATGRVVGLVGRAPIVGNLLGEVLASWGTYQRHKRVLAAAAALCFVIDFFFVGAFYCVAVGLPFEAPSFVHHLMVVPVELTAGVVLPFTPGGMGVREAVVETMYQGFGAPAWQGALIAFGHSLTLLVAGGVATVYYLFKRASVRASLADSGGPIGGQPPQPAKDVNGSG